MRSGRRNGVSGIGERAVANTAMILVVIETMNVVVYCVQFLRYVVPAIMASIILTPTKGCQVEDLVEKNE